MKLKSFLLILGLLFSITTNAQVANQPSDLIVCDDDSDGDDTNGFVQNFNLEAQNSTILGSQSPAGYAVTYHESETDANNSTGALSSPYTNTTANTQTIYARVQDLTNSNFATTNFQIIVSPLPIAMSVVELSQCDDNTDGFSNFNLNEATDLISANSANETFVFYETQSDAQNNINQIANPENYTNQTVTNDVVWARTVSDAGCYRISQVNLVVSTTGIPSSFQRTFNQCDDYLDVNGDDNANNDNTDGIVSFDFSSVASEIIALFPPSQQLTITFYRSEADALSELNAITDISNYRNIGYPNTQDIYVRVDSQLDNACLGLGHHITLVVDPVPVANPVSDLHLNDNDDDGDDSNGIVQNFDLSAQTPLILGSQSSDDFTVTYHTSEVDAIIGQNHIVNTSSYENITPNQQTIYVRVENNSTGCYTNHTSFDLIVNEATASIQEENKLKFTVFPNPADLEITLKTQDFSDRQLTISLFDIQGKLIQNDVRNSYQEEFVIDLTNLSNGIYFLKLTMENRFSTKKLIVNHH